MSTPSSTLPNVLVIGDETLDWLERAKPRSAPHGTDPLRNHQLYPGFSWYPIWGGAALLRDLVSAALKHRTYPVAMNVLERVLDIPKQPISIGKRIYLQSLATIKPMVDGKEKETRLRVERFLGFDGPPADAARKTYVPEDSAFGNPECLVIDDAANGCRFDENFRTCIPPIAKRSKRIIIKLSRPFMQNFLLDEIKKEASATPIIVITNADDLRAQGHDVSWRMSWERTAFDLINASKDGALAELVDLGAVLIRLGADGCVLLRKQGQNFMVFDPKGTEHAFDNKLEGTMPGATSAFVAEIVASVLQSDDIQKFDFCDAMTKALCASRSLIKQGFNDKDYSYPLEVFAKTHLSADEKDFNGITLNSGIDENWNILEQRLLEEAHDGKTCKLPEEYVRYGEAKLKGIPTAKYGELLLIDSREIEGYRSIENLLNEYISSRSRDNAKPLSIAVFGPPGSGKSFGIKQIAKSLEDAKIRIHTFNLTQLAGPEDLVGAFHIARDEALRGNLPMLIFDEFDCALGSDDFGWLKYFLAPMQDGEFKDDGTLHPLSHAIFVFAGGIGASLKEFEKKTAEFTNAKARDFISRLQGFIDVRGINPDKKDDLRCKMRRAVLFRANLLKQKNRTEGFYPIVDDKHQFDISQDVLDLFLDVEKYVYEHGARSMESLIKISRLVGGDHFGIASLPPDSQIQLHAKLRSCPYSN